MNPISAMGGLIWRSSVRNGGNAAPVTARFAGATTAFITLRAGRNVALVRRRF